MITIKRFEQLASRRKFTIAQREEVFNLTTAGRVSEIVGLREMKRLENKISKIEKTMAVECH